MKKQLLTFIAASALTVGFHAYAETGASADANTTNASTNSKTDATAETEGTSDTGTHKTGASYPLRHQRHAKKVQKVETGDAQTQGNTSSGTNEN